MLLYMRLLHAYACHDLSSPQGNGQQRCTAHHLPSRPQLSSLLGAPMRLLVAFGNRAYESLSCPKRVPTL